MKKNFFHSVTASIFAVCFSSVQLLATPSYYTHDATLTIPDREGLVALTSERFRWEEASGMLWDPDPGILKWEGFENAFTPGAVVDYDDFTITGTNLSTNFNKISNNDLITTEGTDVLSFTVTGNGGSVSFDFDNAITAFGIDITSIDWPETNVSFYDDLGNHMDGFVQFTGWANATFFGVTNDEAFSKVVFDFSTSSDILNFDNLEFYRSSNVPEPSSLFFLFLGMCSLGFFRRKK